VAVSEVGGLRKQLSLDAEDRSPLELVLPECRNRILVVTESARMNEAEPGYG
jgi:hypothetical protein